MGDPIGSVLGFKVQTVEECGDRTDDSETRPRDGPEHKYEQRDSAEKGPETSQCVGTDVSLYRREDRDGLGLPH